MNRRPSIIECLDGPIFRHLRMTDGSSWTNWRTLLKAIYGLRLTPEERDFFLKVTGRTKYKPPRGGYRRVLVIVGRRAAK
jgi:hypothetical protein